MRILQQKQPKRLKLLLFLEEQIVPKLKTEVKSDVLKAVSATWKAQLADKVREHEHSAIVFGFPVSRGSLDDAKMFLEKDLKLSRKSFNKIFLKQAVRLGKGDGNRPPPLLMHFSHPSERNLVLSHSVNLKDRSITIEQHVPKIYQAEFKKFKNIAYKLRNMPEMEYQTRIVFDNHQMLLRFKLRDTDDKKYHYITHSDYVPPMEGADSELKSSIQIPQGTIATPVISPSISDKANRSFFMTGMTTQRTQDSFRK